MHELGIVFHIIHSVEELGEKNSLAAVSAVVLEIGQVSTVIGSYLEDCWKWATAKSPLLKEAKLRIENIEAFTHCSSCKKDYKTVKHGRICPFCNSELTYLIQGNEVNIKEIEAS